MHHRLEQQLDLLAVLERLPLHLARPPQVLGQYPSIGYQLETGHQLWQELPRAGKLLFD
jgi:hypothetical protein